MEQFFKELLAPPPAPPKPVEDPLKNPGKGLRDTWEKVKQDEPAYAKRIEPRRYTPQQGFPRPEWVPASCMAMCMAIDLHYSDRAQQTGYIAFRHAYDYGMQQFYVKHDLLEALARTDPPADLRIEEVEFPFPAFFLILPESFTQHYWGCKIHYVVVSRMPKGKHLPPRPEAKFYQGVGEAPDDFLSIYISAEMPQSGFVNYYRTGKGHQQVTEVAEGEMAYYGEWLRADLEAFGHKCNPQIVPEDQEIVRRVYGMVVKLGLLTMSSPELLTPDVRTRSAKIKQGRIVRHELWDPKWLGKNYRIVHPTGQPAAPGTHASPIMHWRRGHFRRQHFGPKDLNQTKMIRVDATIVNAPKPEPPKV
jgi:hypothetical protein